MGADCAVARVLHDNQVNGFINGLSNLTQLTKLSTHAVLACANNIEEPHSLRAALAFLVINSSRMIVNGVRSSSSSSSTTTSTNSRIVVVVVLEVVLAVVVAALAEQSSSRTSSISYSRCD